MIPRKLLGAWLPIALASSASACSVGQKESLVDQTMKNPTTRHESFEATARVLDQHPDYVDEFYQTARRHPPTLDRFLVNTTRDMREPELSQHVARRLIEHPDALERTLLDTVEAAKPHEDARAAIDRAMVERRGPVADMLTDSPETVRKTMISTVDAAVKKPDARAALLRAMRERAPQLAEMMLHDPDTLRTMLDAMAKKMGNDKSAFTDALKGAGILSK